jgi:hypothetical protein
MKLIFFYIRLFSVFRLEEKALRTKLLEGKWPRTKPLRGKRLRRDVLVREGAEDKGTLRSVVLSSVCRHSLLLISQILTVLSYDADASRAESCEKATE